MLRNDRNKSTSQRFIPRAVGYKQNEEVMRGIRGRYFNYQALDKHIRRGCKQRIPTRVYQFRGIRECQRKNIKETNHRVRAKGSDWNEDHIVVDKIGSGQDPTPNVETEHMDSGQPRRS